MTIIRTTKLPADLHKNANLVHQFVMFFVWNALEVNALIISSCIPTLVPLWERARNRATSWSKKEASATSNRKAPGKGYPLKNISSKRSRSHRKLNSQISSSQEHINVEPSVTARDFCDGYDSKYSATISSPGHINDVEQGIHVSTEWDVTEVRKARL